MAILKIVTDNSSVGAISYREQNSLLQKTRNEGISTAVAIRSFDLP